MTRYIWKDLEELTTLLRASRGGDADGRRGEYRIELSGDVFVLVGSVPSTRLRSRVERKARGFARVDKIRNELTLETIALERFSDELLLAHHAGFPQTLDDQAMPGRRLRPGKGPKNKRKKLAGQIGAGETGAAVVSDEIERPARIEVEGAVARGGALVIRVDLPDEPARHGERRVPLDRLPPGWGELRIQVRLAGPMLEDLQVIEPEVLLLEDGPTSPASFRARVKDDASGELAMEAVFFHGSRFCGATTASVPIAGEATRARPTTPAITSAPSNFSVAPAAAGPLLTVTIIAEGSSHIWIWTTPFPLENGEAYERVDASGSAEFATSMFAACPKFGPSDFRQRMESVGERVWDAAPAKFRAAYLELRSRFGKSFAIQLITRDAWMPWEAMKPHGAGFDADHLFLTHPISRWPVEGGNRMYQTVPPGVPMTFAPEYQGKEALPAAQEEKRLMKALFGAEEAQPSRAAFLELLQDASRRATSIVHFAGHATADGGAREGGLKMSAETVTLDDVDRERVRLGENSHSLVILNACEAGQQREQLGMVVGWSAALVRRRFGGFIAPLWKVQDAVAGELMAVTLHALREGTPIGEALRRGREATCEKSIASFAYIAHGDVMMVLGR